MIDKARASEPIEFIQLLKLVGDFTGKPFILQPWQQEVIWNVYGEVNDDGRRRYRYLYLEVPKKNGKTPTVAGLGLYHVTCDPPGGEIYCCAAERDQASQTYNYMKSMIEQSPELSAVLRVVDSKREIHNDATGTFVKVLSAEAYSKHGKAPSVVIFDELHAFQKRDLWDIMTFGTGSARKEPLYLTITTAGDDPDKKSIGWEIHEYARKVRDGEFVDPTWYVKIYGAPDDADIYDEKTWFDANPSLGVAIDIETVRQEALASRNSPASEKLFRWLRLNQWVQLKRIGWLPITQWDKTTRDWQPSELLKKRCYVGIDLARTVDLAGAAPLFPPQEGFDDWRFALDAWIPENRMREKMTRDKVNYGAWEKRGFIKATPGDVIDYSFVAAKIREYESLYNVVHYCSDPWHLEILKQLLGPDIAAKFIDISQDWKGHTPGMNELERLFMSEQISHMENPLGRWCFGNVVIATDGNENMKAMKNKSTDRIDPIVALINAMSGAVRLEQKRSIYELRGMRSLA
ncbi:terminase large subunit [Papillibacter cinnamivorans]|uniref:Phage terminase-like protein, large subunit, contains N-terminal HTH domain n=1 Tax=Papillibacter cinnamivorans DSM 12816 TaxID=1122930 RepID=A0A1W1YQK8_9FIRM|nr:terminase TerL endonuclease subunit [Papillibacter cinnamivorans]SMC38439.1 Phage terminase-like protein, large subunit, contains N-terminal HTH domain [Papillibacter cinnamivorans DSM 12816]